MYKNMINILYEDSDIIVCVKPVGILSQQDPHGNDNMVSILNNHLKENNEHNTVCVVHRLDRNVGGIMVFAKNHKAAASLSKDIQERKFLKQYLLVVQGKPEQDQGLFEDLLFKDSSKNKTFVVRRIRKGVKKASLEYKLIETYSEETDIKSLLRVKLHTGRTHQIRVQFSSRKMPLLGDKRYGSRDDNCDIALWSEVIGFKHPATNKYMEYRVLPDNEYPWKLFRYL